MSFTKPSICHSRHCNRLDFTGASREQVRQAEAEHEAWLDRIYGVSSPSSKRWHLDKIVIFAWRLCLEHVFCDRCTSETFIEEVPLAAEGSSLPLAA